MSSLFVPLAGKLELSCRNAEFIGRHACLNQSVKLCQKKYLLGLSIHPLPHVFGRGGSNCPVYTGLSLAAPAPPLCSDQWKGAAVEDTVVHVGPVKASPRADSYPADFNRRSPQTHFLFKSTLNSKLEVRTLLQKFANNQLVVFDVCIDFNL